MIPESYLSHALGEQRANHRYIARVPIGNNRNRYFYSIDEYRAFRNGGRKSLGDRLDAARSKAAKNVGDVSKTIANRNQAVRKKAEDATWNALSKINHTTKSVKNSTSNGLNKATNTIDKVAYKTGEAGLKTLNEIVKAQKTVNSPEFYKSLKEQSDAAAQKRQNNRKYAADLVDKGMNVPKGIYNNAKKQVNDTVDTVKQIPKDLKRDIDRPIDSGVDKNSSMKKWAEEMNKSNRKMSNQVKYDNGYHVKPLTNLDVISTTAAKGAANVANRVSAQATTKTKQHMAEAKKQVDEGIKRSENYWTKKDAAKKDVADASDAIAEKAKSTADKGKDFINGVFDKAKAKAKDTADDVVDAVKSKGREASSSASKKFEELGRQTRSNIDKSAKEATEKSAQKLKATIADVEAGYQKISATARKYGDEISDWPKAAQKEYYEWLSKYHELTGK